MSSDGMGVGVMLELARVLIDRNEAFDGNVLFCRSLPGRSLITSMERSGRYEYKGSQLILETLQDGSHMFSTQHHTAKT